MFPAGPYRTTAASPLHPAPSQPPQKRPFRKPSRFALEHDSAISVHNTLAFPCFPGPLCPCVFILCLHVHLDPRSLCFPSPYTSISIPPVPSLFFALLGVSTHPAPPELFHIPSSWPACSTRLQRQQQRRSTRAATSSRRAVCTPCMRCVANSPRQQRASHVVQKAAALFCTCARAIQRSLF